jgi:hypothetical protein
MKETKGMSNQTECDRVWKGVDCHNGYRKEFFSQTMEFLDGACIGVPTGCEDSFYFPANTNVSCEEWLDQSHHLCRSKIRLPSGVVVKTKRETSIQSPHHPRAYYNAALTIVAALLARIYCKQARRMFHQRLGHKVSGTSREKRRKH